MTNYWLSLFAIANGVPEMPPPDPLGYPVPAWILQALSYLTLTLHFLAMNFTIGAALLLLWTYIRKRPGHQNAGLFLGSSLPLGLSYAITLGIPPLLFVQVLYGQLFYSSSVLLGAFWIQVIPALILAYAGFYYHKLGRASRPRFQWLVVAASTLLLLYIGFIYVNNLTLAMTPEKWLGLYAEHPGGGVLQHGEPTVHPRYLLFISGAFAVAGLGLIWRGTYLIKWGLPDQGRRSQSFGIRAFFVTPVLWLVAALGLYFARPDDVSAILSSESWAVPLVLGAVAATALAGILAYLAVGRHTLAQPLLASLALFAAVACMVVLRDLVRIRVLSPHFSLASVPVNAQWGMFALFVAALAGGLILLIVLFIKSFPAMADQASQRLAEPVAAG